MCYDESSLQINFHYISQHPKRAVTWLRAVLKERKSIPQCLRNLLANPLSTTPKMSFETCNDVLWWAEQYDGFHYETTADDYRSLIIYSDMKVLVNESDAAKKFIKDDHAWIQMARMAALEDMS